MEALQAEISGLLTPGNELVVAGAIALYGTAQIAREKHEILREHFSEGFLREAENPGGTGNGFFQGAHTPGDN